MDRDNFIRSFVAGAKWWEYQSIGFTMWPSDQTQACVIAGKRFDHEQARDNCAAEHSCKIVKECGRCLSGCEFYPPVGTD